MACKTETKQIGDREYSVTQWAADKALINKVKLIKILGSSLVTLASNAKAREDIQLEALSSALVSLFKNSNPEDIVSFMKDCIVGVACDGKKITATTFNELFSGDDLIDVYKVFIFVIQVNYGNFIKGRWVETLSAKMKDIA